MLTTVTTATPPAVFLHLVVGYDGSPPASRALDAAVRLLQDRPGRIDVVYVAHLSSLAMLSPGAIAEIESDFDEIEQQLRTAAAEQLRDRGAAWGFERRQGIVPEELTAMAIAIGEAIPTLAVPWRSWWAVRHTPPTGLSVRSPSAWPVTRRCR